MEKPSNHYTCYGTCYCDYTYFGHTFSKTCQYATIDEKVCKGL